MVEYVYNNAKYKSTGMILFEAEYRLNLNIYKFRIPPKSRIHPIVHVSLLKLTNKDIPLVTNKVK